MFDLFEYLGPKRRKLLDDSWAGIFRSNVRHELPVDLLARHYCASNGRPTNELVAMMGTMILQHMHDLTDQETVEQFAFNIQWHYALSRYPGRPKMFAETESGNTTLVRGSQVDRPEPLEQRQVGRMKDRPRRHAGLMVAMATLVGFS